MKKLTQKKTEKQIRTNIDIEDKPEKMFDGYDHIHFDGQFPLIIVNHGSTTRRLIFQNEQTFGPCYSRYCSAYAPTVTDIYLWPSHRRLAFAFHPPVDINRLINKILAEIDENNKLTNEWKLIGIQAKK